MLAVLFVCFYLVIKVFLNHDLNLVVIDQVSLYFQIVLIVQTLLYNLHTCFWRFQLDLEIILTKFPCLQSLVAGLKYFWKFLNL